MVLAIDYGTKKTGFAVSDETFLLSIALKTLFTSRNEIIFEHIEKLQKQYALSKIVVGVPSGWQNQDSPQTTIVRDFIVAIKEHFDLPIVEWDESYSSKIAEKELVGKQKKNSDSYAAAYILQEYLDYLRYEKKSV